MFTTSRSLFLIPVLASIAAAATGVTPPPEFTLWPRGKAPGSEGNFANEKAEPPTGDRNFTTITSVHNPTLTVYLPSKEKATGASIIVAPGGGHRMLAMHEGYDIGEWLASRGIAGFVLKYRLGREAASPYKVEVHPQLDAQRAIRTVRARAKEWQLDPDRIGIMGFSAGGEVALRVSLNYDAGNPAAADPIDRVSSKPGFQILVYPGIKEVPLEGINKETPPTFLICTNDDKSPAERLPNLYLALMNARVPAEMHIYTHGGHGYGIRKRPLPVSTWNERLIDWLNDLGLLEK